jgi:hypothetical protein
MSRRVTRGLLAAAGAALLAIGMMPSAASAAAVKIEICLSAGFCMPILGAPLPSTPVPGEFTVSGSAAGVSAEGDVSLQ